MRSFSFSILAYAACLYVAWVMTFPSEPVLEEVLVAVAGFIGIVLTPSAVSVPAFVNSLVAGIFITLVLERATTYLHLLTGASAPDEEGLGGVVSSIKHFIAVMAAALISYFLSRYWVEMGEAQRTGQLHLLLFTLGIIVIGQVFYRVPSAEISTQRHDVVCVNG